MTNNESNQSSNKHNLVFYVKYIIMSLAWEPPQKNKYN